MRISWDKPRLEPAEFYELLKRHVLLPMHLGDERMLKAVKATAEAGRFGMILEGDGVLATTMTFLIEPGVLEFILIPEVRKLDERKNGLIDVVNELRAVWFTPGIRRVEARVPQVRSLTKRVLRVMGFTQETQGTGLRGAVDYGNGPEGLAVFSLLPTDPLKEKVEEMEVAHG